MLFYVLFASLIVAAVVLPFITPRAPKRTRLAGVLLGLAGLELSASAQIAGLTSSVGVILLAAGVYFAKEAWSEFSEDRIIRRGEAAVAKASSGANEG